MWPRRAADPPQERDLLAIAPDVRRVVSARVSDEAAVADITQEALARAWEARWRLDRRTLAGYAIVTARNLVTSEERRQAIHDRYAPRLADAPYGPSPEEEILQREEHAALSTALRRLDRRDRTLLSQHELDDRSVSDLAESYDTSAGAISARLARARARLRVEYLLAFRRVTLPTPSCRHVLLALAAGDRRRQNALRASEHLVGCPTCASLSDVLLTRRRGLAGVVAPFLGWLIDRLRGRLTSQQATTVATVLGATGALLTAVALVGLQLANSRSQEPPTVMVAPATSPPGSLMVDGTVVLPAPAVEDLSRYVDQTAVATRVPVRSVPANEGFWIGWNDRARVWVQFAGPGESRVTVRRGQVVSFNGSVVAHDEEFPREVGVSRDEGAAQMAGQQAHIVVPESRLVLQ